MGLIRFTPISGVYDLEGGAVPPRVTAPGHVHLSTMRSQRLPERSAGPVSPMYSGRLLIVQRRRELPGKLDAAC